ncbi:MAG: hypothetical protein KatS3mg118_2790 [Paracoccaceae bacterium]|nr:MAG: hypothetical protein KatS3mg118_2790 [Paracoccaceae bacterium]
MTRGIRPWRDIRRRESRRIHVGNVPVGGGAPISVQTMTNTDTRDVAATIAQIRRCAEAGADIVRVSVPDAESAAALKAIVAASPVPIVADIHFHYRRAIEAAEAGAACLRINPGNIGSPRAGARGDPCGRARPRLRDADRGQCRQSLERHLLEKYGEPCPEALVESRARAHDACCEENDFREYKVSVKASDVFLAAAAYQAAGRGDGRAAASGHHRGGRARSRGTVKSAIGLGNLLWMGIGDTIRVSAVGRSGRGGAASASRS